jgi:hypothetical protein
VEREMTKHIVQVPNPAESQVKAALLDVVDFLHQWGDVQRMI